MVKAELKQIPMVSPITKVELGALVQGHECKCFGASALLHADCFSWLASTPDNSIHAVVTDPPYGVKEYEDLELAKLKAGVGGTWRIPPSFDGSNRSALPRFTALNEKERRTLRAFFLEWAAQLHRVIRPGGHVFVASNSFLSQIVFQSISEGGLEFRGEFIRLVRTLRGGDKPKNYESVFPQVCSMPRGCYEPWGIFRKSLPKGMTVGECLSEFQTGGLRRDEDGTPFDDVAVSERTPRREREIADHPSLKPQSLLRKLVFASLPLGQGIVLDPFAGSGSTVAAAEAIGYQCIGLERYREYYEVGLKAIPLLSKESICPVSQQGDLFSA